MTFPHAELGQRWSQLREELAPFIGERAVSLLTFALADASGSAIVAEPARRALVDSGEDPDDPQVTEAEQLLIDWARVVGGGAAEVTPDLSERLERTFTPRLREVLAAFAEETVRAR